MSSTLGEKGIGIERVLNDKDIGREEKREGQKKKDAVIVKFIFSACKQDWKRQRKQACQLCYMVRSNRAFSIDKNGIQNCNTVLLML